MSDSLSFPTIERQTRIVEFVEAHHQVTVPHIAAEFSISLATARRDLETLAQRGRVRRVHGGAMAIEQAPPEPPALQRTGEQTEAKKRIGTAVAQLIEERETVFLGSGTTVLEVAHQLRNRQSLTVITNSLLVVNALADNPDISLVCLGGFFRRSELSFIGHITEQALFEVRADKVILGIRAVDVEQGLTNDYLQETMTDRAILKIGREIIVVADHTKLGRTSTAFVAPLTAIHTLATDSGASPEFLERVAVTGVRVIKA